MSRGKTIEIFKVWVSTIPNLGSRSAIRGEPELMHPIRPILRAFTFICVFTCVSSALHALDPKLLTEDTMLETVRFRLFGNEKEDVAEIRLDGDQYHLRLFNEKLASYYSVKIPAEDLISTEPLGTVVSAQISAKRTGLIRERELLRAERRKKAKLERSRKDVNRSGSNNSSGSDSRSTGAGVIHEEVSRDLGKQGYLSLLEDFGNRVEGMQDRLQGVLNSGQGFVSHLESWAQESDSKPRVFHALKNESLSIVEAAESLRKSLKSRLKEISRTLEQSRQGHLKVRDLAEIIDRIRQRLVRCEEKLGELESLEMACSDGLDSLGGPLIRAEEAVELVGSDSAKKRSPANFRGDPAASEKRVSILPASFNGVETDLPVEIEDRQPVIDNITRETVVPQKPGSDSSGTVGELKKLAGNEKSDFREDSPAEEPPVNRTGGGARDILLGAIFGAILVLGLGRLIKALP